MSTGKANNEIHLQGLFSDSGALSERLFGESAWFIIERSLIRAETLGRVDVGLSALLLSMVDQASEDDANESVHEIKEKLNEIFRTNESLESPKKSLELTGEFLTENVQQALLADRVARPEVRRAWRSLKRNQILILHEKTVPCVSTTPKPERVSSRNDVGDTTAISVPEN